MERPTAEFTIKTNNGVALLDSVESILTQKGFKIDDRDDDAYQMTASRKLRSDPNGVEKILLWLDRDFKNPDTNIKIYFMYGLYMKIFGGGDENKRIKITPEQEKDNIGDIKNAIRKINIKI